jgi:uncharacterized SAM-binding protein YcdF (DUF218 family)
MKRALMWFIATVIVCGLLAAGAFFGLGFYLSPQSPLQKSDAIVAISGGDTVERMKEAVRLYEAGWAPKIIFSGAALDPSSPSNAKVMAVEAEARGVPKTAIILDETSVNTEANATDVAKIILNNKFTKIILVTSPYHQRRASILFRRALGDGITVLNQSSYDMNWRRSDWWANASSRSITLSEFQKSIYETLTGK